MIKTKGQSTLEYATIITIIVTSLTVMSTYVQRSIQANLKIIENQINGQPGEPADSGAISQGDGSSETYTPGSNYGNENNADNAINDSDESYQDGPYGSDAGASEGDMSPPGENDSGGIQDHADNETTDPDAIAPTGSSAESGVDSDSDIGGDISPGGGSDSGEDAPVAASGSNSVSYDNPSIPYPPNDIFGPIDGSEKDDDDVSDIDSGSINWTGGDRINTHGGGYM